MHIGILIWPWRQWNGKKRTCPRARRVLRTCSLVTRKEQQQKTTKFKGLDSYKHRMWDRKAAPAVKKRRLEKSLSKASVQGKFKRPFGIVEGGKGIFPDSLFVKNHE